MNNLRCTCSENQRWKRDVEDPMMEKIVWHAIGFIIVVTNGKPFPVTGTQGNNEMLDCSKSVLETNACLAK